MLVPIGIALALSIFTGLVALVCTVRWLAAVREGEYLVEALVATGIAALCTSICVNMIRNWIHPKVWSSALTQDSLFWTGPKNAGTVPLSEISSLLIEGNHWVSVIDKQGKAWSVPMTCLGSLPKFVQILRAHFPEIQVTVTRWGARRTGIFVPRGLPTRSSR
ncbi:MAG TPA: hypothetical protein VMF30_18505 [Pirellulales bacterium]|nr:hypothetical protein [Pirellulales bacterium]